MSPKPKSVPPRLVPPPQLRNYYSSAPAGKFQPKMREVLGRQAKLIARFLHANLTWKKILMSWMVLLVASKMVLLMLTYRFFTMTALLSRPFSGKLTDTWGRIPVMVVGAAVTAIVSLFYPFFLSGVAAQPELNLDDGIHPNRDGVAVIVDRIVPYVVRLLEKRVRG